MNHGITAGGTRNDQLGAGIGDFIERYIFPGGELLHVSQVLREMGEAGLEPLDVENLRPHYARTLWAWSDALEARLDAGARRSRARACVRAYRALPGRQRDELRARLDLAVTRCWPRVPTGDVGDGPMRGAQSPFPVQPRATCTRMS